MRKERELKRKDKKEYRMTKDKERLFFSSNEVVVFLSFSTE